MHHVRTEALVFRTTMTTHTDAFAELDLMGIIVKLVRDSKIFLLKVFLYRRYSDKWRK